MEPAIIYPMCGRYRLSREKQLVDEYFGNNDDEDCVKPVEPDSLPAQAQLFRVRASLIT